MQFSEDAEFAFNLEKNGRKTWLLKVRYNRDFYERLLLKSHLFFLAMERMENLCVKINGKTDDFFKAQISVNNKKLVIDLSGSLNGLYLILGRAGLC